MVTKAKREAIARYDAKTYRQVAFKLRKEDDADIIRDLDEAQKRGISRREWLKAIFEVYRAHQK